MTVDIGTVQASMYGCCRGNVGKHVILETTGRLSRHVPNKARKIILKHPTCNTKFAICCQVLTVAASHYQVRNQILILGLQKNPSNKSNSTAKPPNLPRSYIYVETSTKCWNCQNVSGRNNMSGKFHYKAHSLVTSTLSLHHTYY